MSRSAKAQELVKTPLTQIKARILEVKLGEVKKNEGEKDATFSKIM